MAEITIITLIALFLLWTCREGSVADGMTFEALLGRVILANANVWISLAILKTRARAKLRAKLPLTALQRRSDDFQTRS